MKKWAAKKKTLNFSQQSLDALADLVKATGKTETDIVNDAVQAMHRERAKGGIGS